MKLLNVEKLLALMTSLSLTSKIFIGIVILFSMGLLIAFQFFSFNEGVNEACATDYPNSFVARVQCIHRMDAQEKKDKAELEIKKAKQISANAARGCIAENIGRMESIVRELQAATDDNLTLMQLKPTFDNIIQKGNTPKYIEYHGEVDSAPQKTSEMLVSSTGKETLIVPASDDIKERVLVAIIAPFCETSFNLLVNVRASESGKIDSFKVWAINPPIGYHDGLHGEFSVDYEARRAAKEMEAKGKKSKLLDPCAPNITKAERLQRLSQYGVVRQESDSEYSAGGHRITFEKYYPRGALESCH